jgi:hypothetical protein
LNHADLGVLGKQAQACPDGRFPGQAPVLLRHVPARPQAAAGSNHHSSDRRHFASRNAKNAPLKPVDRQAQMGFTA